MLANAEFRRIAGSALTTSEILANLGMPLCTIWLDLYQTGYRSGVII